ncbi:MAG: hypothetical protein IPK26_09075 [Planctomycetes bacterium]|nr:hypothetical protein [Planctomycetota bacterium]
MIGSRGLLAIRIVHTMIFLILSACVLLVLQAGVTGVATTVTIVAIAAILLEGAALWSCRGRCPLTVLAERHGAVDGAVADIFLPKWFADRIFPICGSLFLLGCLLLAWRLLLG